MRNWKVYENETTPFGDWKILSCWRDEVLYYSEQNFTNTQRQDCASEDTVSLVYYNGLFCGTGHLDCILLLKYIHQRFHQFLFFRF